MFLSLVRPDRILSPITRRAATSLGVVALRDVMIRPRGDATVRREVHAVSHPAAGLARRKTSTREGERTDKHILPPAGGACNRLVMPAIRGCRSRTGGRAVITAFRRLKEFDSILVAPERKSPEYLQK